jgi:hypothetical protein
LRPAQGPSAPDSDAGEQVFMSRRERRAYEQALAQDAQPAVTQTSFDATSSAAVGPQPGWDITPPSYAAPAPQAPSAESTARAYVPPSVQMQHATPIAPPRTTAAPQALPAEATPHVTRPSSPGSGAQQTLPASPSHAVAQHQALPQAPAASLAQVAQPVQAARPAGVAQPVQTLTPTPQPERDSFAELLGLFEEPQREAAQRATADVRETDARRTDPRRSPDATRGHQPDEVPVTTHTGRLRLRPDELARATDSAPVPIALPGPGAEATWAATSAPAIAAASGARTRGGRDSESTQSQNRRHKSKRELRAEAKEARREERESAKAAKRDRREHGHPESRDETRRSARSTGARPLRGSEPQSAEHRTRPQTSPSASRAARMVPRPIRKPVHRGSRMSRLIGKATIMVTAAGLVATTAVPAYAQFDSPFVAGASMGKVQTLAVGAVQNATVDRSEYGAHTLSTALDSTLGTVVPPETQALARQLMTAVTQGRLTGSSPDHIFEIRYLAAGEAVPGCGIDYRVLQTIAFALTKFNTVGVSDINRHCTGQIEGAGTASAHYTDGGGHAVDFFLLNGHSLSGGDSDSVRLIEALDAVVPSDSTVGQEGCRSSLSLVHFQQIPDTCNHVHIDFLDASGATLLG